MKSESRRLVRVAWADYPLIVVTILALSFNVWFYLGIQAGLLGRELAGWPWPRAYLSDVIVATPIVGLCCSVALLGYWLAARGRMSNRSRLAWAFALSAVIFGWPTACACLFVRSPWPGGVIAH